MREEEEEEEEVGRWFRWPTDEEKMRKREREGKGDNEGLEQRKRSMEEEEGGRDEDMQGFTLKGGLNNAKVLII